MQVQRKLIIFRKNHRNNLYWLRRTAIIIEKKSRAKKRISIKKKKRIETEMRKRKINENTGAVENDK